MNPQDNYIRIRDCLRIGHYKNNPHASAEDLSLLSGEYAFVCNQLEDILIGKPAWWNKERKEHKSDSACEKSWEQTENGINEMGLRLRLKAMDKMSSALKSLIRIAESEAHNLY